MSAHRDLAYDDRRRGTIGPGLEITTFVFAQDIRAFCALARDLKIYNDEAPRFLRYVAAGIAAKANHQEELERRYARQCSDVVGLSDKELPGRRGRLAVSENRLSGLSALGHFWSAHRGEPIDSSRNRGGFGRFIQSFFEPGRQRLHDENRTAKHFDSISRVTDGNELSTKQSSSASRRVSESVNTALRGYLEGRRERAVV